YPSTPTSQFRCPTGPFGSRSTRAWGGGPAALDVGRTATPRAHPLAFCVHLTARRGIGVAPCWTEHDSSTEPEVHYPWRPTSTPLSGDADWARSCAGSARTRA